VSHLGERLTALVDGELEHDERDRAYAHLTACAHCRSEADALRRLKKRMRSLPDTVPPGDFLARLHAIGGSGGADPGRPARETRPLPGGTRPPQRRGLRPGRRAPAGTRPPGDGRPRRGPSVVRGSVVRGRHLVMGAATLAVLGVGAASVVAVVGPERLPQVAPALERFAVQQVLLKRDAPVPATSPVADRHARP
jgi:anti-sigma factor RsiW